AVEAAKKAISSRLLEEGSIQGARGVLINITEGTDLLLHEVSEASGIIHDAADLTVLAAPHLKRLSSRMNGRLVAFILLVGVTACGLVGSTEEVGTVRQAESDQDK